MGPAGLLLAGMLVLNSTSVELRWDPAPGAYAYRVYICTANVNQCWPVNPNYWSLLDQQPTPVFVGQQPTVPTWAVVANVFPGREVIRVSESLYLRPGARYVER